MADPTPAEQRRRWINIGEIVAVAGLLVSGLALWNSWGRDRDSPPTTIVERQRAIPLALRGTIEDDGKRLVISPVEPGHALESLTLVVAAKSPLDLGSEPRLSAGAVERLLPDGTKEGIGALTVRLDAHYIEAGTDRRQSDRYRLTYRWTGGGLLGGRSLRLTGMRRG